MNRIRSSLAPACGGFSLACLLVCARPTGAQTFVELGGGWNYLAPPPAGQSYGHGFDVQASIGRQFTPDFLIRFDAFTNQFAETVPLVSRLNNPGPICNGCPPPVYTRPYNGVAGLTASGLVNVDARGMLYVIGGAGFYDTYGGAPRVSLGLSAGAGVSVPVGGRFRAFAEAREHFVFGANSQPPWLVPITVGLRY
jgi:hypothetical protein